MPIALSPLARRLLPLLDATALDPALTPQTLGFWCEQLRTLPLAPAAVCVRPQSLTACRSALAETPIRLAVVCNFPLAPQDLTMCALCTDAIGLAQAASAAQCAGADELDLLFPYAAYLQGQESAALACVRAVRESVPDMRLKLILESGAFPDAQTLLGACMQAVEAGVDMLKTSSGYHPQGASLAAAEVFCTVSTSFSKMVGIKISGGIRTLSDASPYLELIAQRLGLAWGTPALLRFGASRWLDELTAGASFTKAGG